MHLRTSSTTTNKVMPTRQLTRQKKSITSVTNKATSQLKPKQVLKASRNIANEAAFYPQSSQENLPTAGGRDTIFSYSTINSNKLAEQNIRSHNNLYTATSLVPQKAGANLSKNHSMSSLGQVKSRASSKYQNSNGNHNGSQSNHQANNGNLPNNYGNLQPRT